MNIVTLHQYSWQFIYGHVFLFDSEQLTHNPLVFYFSAKIFVRGGNPDWHPTLSKGLNYHYFISCAEALLLVLGVVVWCKISERWSLLLDGELRDKLVSQIWKIRWSEITSATKKVSACKICDKQPNHQKKKKKLYAFLVWAANQLSRILLKKF